MNINNVNMNVLYNVPTYMQLLMHATQQYINNNNNNNVIQLDNEHVK